MTKTKISKTKDDKRQDEKTNNGKRKEYFDKMIANYQKPTIRSSGKVL